MSVRVNDMTAQAITVVKNITEGEMRDYVQTVVEIGKEEAPYDTGNLKRSIAWDNPDRGKLKYRVFTQTGYGGYVHQGTVRIKTGNPFLTRAIERTKGEFARAMRGIGP